MRNQLSRRPRAAGVLGALSAALLAAACATDVPRPETNAGVHEAYLLGVIDRLPSANARDIDSAPREELYLWGSEICAQLRAGKPEKQTTADVAEYFGPALTHALVASAKDVICPEMLGTKRTAL